MEIQILYQPKGDMLRLMTTRLLVFVMFLSTGMLASSENRGTCPPSPIRPKVVTPKPYTPQGAPSLDPQSGTLTVTAVVSDRGFVCDAWIVRGFEKKTENEAAERAIREWRFQPATKGGHFVPVVVNVEVTWRRDGGKLSFPAGPAASQTKDEPAVDK